MRHREGVNAGAAREFDLLALSPIGLLDPAIPIAACRAGAVGVLDLTGARNPASAASALLLFLRSARGRVGVRVDADAVPALGLLPAEAKAAVGHAVVADTDAEDARVTVEALGKGDREVLVEVTTLEALDAAMSLPVDGLVAKGSESAGHAGEETALDLLHGLCATDVPVYVHGGIGLDSAAAAVRAGAAGAVLDSQLLLARESSISPDARAAIARMDGSETAVVGSELGLGWRVYDHPGARATMRLKDLAHALARPAGEPGSEQVAIATWRAALRDRGGWGSPADDVLVVGEDAALARSLADRFGTVGRTLEAFREAVDDHAAAPHRPEHFVQSGVLARPPRGRNGQATSPPVLGDFFEHSGFWNFGYRVEGGESQVEACEQLMEELLAALPPTRGPILDVACGEGATTRYLTNYFDPGDITGITSSDDELECCRSNVPGGTFLEMDAARLEFDDESFDHVICAQGAARFDTRKRFLAEALRVLRRDGCLVMADVLLSPESPVQPPGNYVASEIEYQELWDEAGFAQVEVVDATEECWGGFAEHLALFMDERLLSGSVAWPVYHRLTQWLRRSNVERCLLASGLKP